MMTYYKFIFADGYELWARGLSVNERRREEMIHGKLVLKRKEG